MLVLKDVLIPHLKPGSSGGGEELVPLNPSTPLNNQGAL